MRILYILGAFAALAYTLGLGLVVAVWPSYLSGLEAGTIAALLASGLITAGFSTIFAQIFAVVDSWIARVVTFIMAALMIIMGLVFAGARLPATGIEGTGVDAFVYIMLFLGTLQSGLLLYHAVTGRRFMLGTRLAAAD